MHTQISEEDDDSDQTSDLQPYLVAVYKHLFKSKSKVPLYLRLCENVSRVKPVLSGRSKIDKTKVLKANGSLMKVESIAECSPWSILQYF